MALPPPINPPSPGPTSSPPGSNHPRVMEYESERDRHVFEKFDTDDLGQLSNAPIQTVAYNSEEEELYGKRGNQSWSPVDIPLGVMGTAMNRFFALISDALEFLEGVKRQGVPRWSGQHTYSSRARAVGTDNRMYKSLVETGPRANNVQDPVTEAEPRTIWVLDEPEMMNTGHVVAGGRIKASGTLVTAESWGVGSVTRAGNDPDSYVYTIVLDAGVDAEGYHVQVVPLNDVTDMEVIPVASSTPPRFTVQFEKRVSQTVVHEGIARGFTFAVYAK